MNPTSSKALREEAARNPNLTFWSDKLHDFVQVAIGPKFPTPLYYDRVELGKDEEFIFHTYFTGLDYLFAWCLGECVVGIVDDQSMHISEKWVLKQDDPMYQLAFYALGIPGHSSPENCWSIAFDDCSQLRVYSFSPTWVIPVFSRMTEKNGDIEVVEYYVGNPESRTFASLKALVTTEKTAIMENTLCHDVDLKSSIDEPQFQSIHRVIETWELAGKVLSK